MVREQFNPGRKLNRALSRTEQLRPVLLKWGILGVEASQNAFSAQRYGASEWKPRAVPNVYGLIADFADGRDPPPRRMQARPALRDTGNLMRSINYKLSGRSVRIGTAVQYARVLHEGGAIESRKITKKVQRRASKWLEQQPSKVRKSLEWLTSPENTGTYVMGQVEARPFIGATPELIDMYQRVLREHIKT